VHLLFVEGALLERGVLPPTRKCGFLPTGRGGDTRLEERLELVVEIGEVGGIGRQLEDLVQDGQKVVEGANGGERWGLLGSKSAPGGAEEECGLDGHPGNTSAV
jgi:hypothetical protein